MEQIRIAVIVTYDRNPLSLLYIPNSIFGTSPILKIGHPLKTSVGLMQHFTIPTSEKEENIYVWACIHIFNFFFFFYVCLIISPKRFDQPGWFIMRVAGYVFRLVRLKRIFRFGPRKQFFFFKLIFSHRSCVCSVISSKPLDQSKPFIPFAYRRACYPADPFTIFYCVCFL